MLSAREREVLQRLDGRQDKQIAAELGVSAHGVRYHLRNLFAKLGARNRAEALSRAREAGLIPDDSGAAATRKKRGRRGADSSIGA